MAPTRKVNAGGFTSMVAVVTAWAFREFLRVEVPLEVGLAMAGILVYVVQYLVPDK